MYYWGPNNCDILNPAPDKVDMYNFAEKLRDPSHVKALTISEFEDLFKEAGIPIKRKGFYKLRLE